MYLIIYLQLEHSALFIKKKNEKINSQNVTTLLICNQTGTQIPKRKPCVLCMNTGVIKVEYNSFHQLRSNVSLVILGWDRYLPMCCFWLVCQWRRASVLWRRCSGKDKIPLLLLFACWDKENDICAFFLVSMATTYVTPERPRGKFIPQAREDDPTFTYLMRRRICGRVLSIGLKID